MSDTKADYGVLGIGPASGIISGNAFVGAYQEPITTKTIDSGGMSGVYSGSLSAQGNMVAMQLNPGGYNFQPTGRYITVKVGDTESSTYAEVLPAPYLSGYIKTYMKDPKQCTFGADTAMPALFGVMPNSVGVPGNMSYYLDLQLSRLTGSNYFDPYQFVNTIGQVVGWVTTSNSYLAALNNAEKTDLNYYRANNYQTLITQGFAKYAQGVALPLAFKRIGLVAESINTGHFGTVNAVAKTLIDHGLGFINNFTDHLLQQGVVYSDIYSSKYTAIINAELLAINNASDLDTIQQVLESSIRNFKNPTDYCYIETASGLPNDSAFKDLAEVGVDFHNRAPGFTLTKGADIATLLQSLQSDVPTTVENLASDKSLLKQDIINNLRSFMPTGNGNGPISVLNVIGAASGYLTNALNAVNEGMEELYATKYGPQLRQKLEDISRYSARVPISAAEEQAAMHWVDGTGLSYYESKYNDSVVALIDVINAVISDRSGRMPALVSKINDNYLYVCQQLAYEFTNFNKANMTINIGGVKDNNAILGFVGSLPGYAIDRQNLGTDTMLYGTAQSNEAGDLVRTILNQSKNSSLLSAAGVTITGII